MAEPRSSTDLIVSSKAVPVKMTHLWSEPLDTAGLIPQNLKRAATAQYPILEILQRLLFRIKSSGGDLEKVLALIGLFQAVRPVYGYIKDVLAWALTVQVTIPDTDPVAKDVLAWMGSEVLMNNRTRNAMLVTGGSQDPNDDYHRRMLAQLMARPKSVRIPEKAVDEVLCLPPIGTRLFWVGYRPFLFSRRGATSSYNAGLMVGSLVDSSGQLQNSLTIMTPGWSLKPLKDFTKLCRDFKLRHMTGTTTVYFAGAGRYEGYGQGWQSVSKAIRKLDTIDMDERTKSDVIRDAEYYYSDQSRQFFADCGIPYRRGYLFHGPPGTGKSSFSAALAGHLGCDIYHINLSAGMISDGGLHSLFLGLPRKCIVVIEDIDSAGIGREPGPSSKVPPTEANLLQGMYGMPGVPEPPPNVSESHRSRRSMITLSGLLNAIDGNASQEGRLLIMTSNNPDALDAALTRPGRIDKKIYFGNMTRSAGRSIFKRLIGRSALAHDAAFTMAQIDQYAEAFADKVPANTFTPAQVQNFLQGCRGDPIKALADIDAWVLENREDALSNSVSEKAASNASDPVVVDLADAADSGTKDATGETCVRREKVA
ncbi:P-loop containing nucleoside triphosphate hydrolase protein [Plenodomus tracheiphilus IPT5]|uniref:P-loop containing nucleoside triphosphate hydrolase protein n=1 Tax=Plenodomus tracheiphilus IPT5 TaxID=1408161 RepID=A0A6A7ASJ2_9PLEO|nr:P-loop containing nucleoside triphosphate hydrolase protein [Plenodomus tracheiphilus IPT5]